MLSTYPLPIPCNLLKFPPPPPITQKLSLLNYESEIENLGYAYLGADLG